MSKVPLIPPELSSPASSPAPVQHKQIGRLPSESSAAPSPAVAETKQIVQPPLASGFLGEVYSTSDAFPVVSAPGSGAVHADVPKLSEPDIVLAPVYPGAVEHQAPPPLDPPHVVGEQVPVENIVPWINTPVRAVDFSLGCYQIRQDVEEYKVKIERLKPQTVPNDEMNRRIAVCQLVHSDKIRGIPTVRDKNVTDGETELTFSKPDDTDQYIYFDFAVGKKDQEDLLFELNTAVVTKAIKAAWARFPDTDIELQIAIRSEIGPEPTVQAAFNFLRDTPAFTNMLVISTTNALDLKKYMECVKVLFPLGELKEPTMRPVETGCVLL